MGTEAEQAHGLQDKLEEFMNYVRAKFEAIPNYADRRTPNGAHRLPQIRARILNPQLRGDFQRWYPRLRLDSEPVRMAA
jgi:hypothetical protein